MFLKTKDNNMQCYLSHPNIGTWKIIKISEHWPLIEIGRYTKTPRKCGLCIGVIV